MRIQSLRRFVRRRQRRMMQRETIRILKEEANDYPTEMEWRGP